MNSYDIINDELERLHKLIEKEGPNRKWAREKIDEIHIDLFNVGEVAQESVEHIERELELPDCPTDLMQ